MWIKKTSKAKSSPDSSKINKLNKNPREMELSERTSRRLSQAFPASSP
jgi:hypothetical protein